MRKFIVIILAAIYIVASTGASINIHYCMGKLVDWTLNSDKKEFCTYCGMANKDSSEGCCKDDHKFVKNTDDQKTVIPFQLLVLSSASIPSSYIDKPERFLTSVTEHYPQSNAPPRPDSVPVYLSNCLFRI